MKVHVREFSSRNRPDWHYTRATTGGHGHTQEGENTRTPGKVRPEEQQEEKVQKTQKEKVFIFLPIVLFISLEIAFTIILFLFATGQKVKDLCDAEKTYTMNYLHNRNGLVPYYQPYH